jgi:ABC-2 type transport system ATP-binding protein
MDRQAISVNDWSTDYVVETTALTKRFGDRTVVDHVDLRVPRGSAFGYLGPNGAGKTTLIRMLLGLTEASAGTMSLLGRPVPAEREQALSRVGAIVEEPLFHGFLTGRENLWVIAAARGRAAEARIDGCLARVGLSERADDRAGNYSLGMRQRLGIAACLLGDPELLLLDEPMNGLDPAGMLEIREMIRSFVDEGRTVVLSSHLLDEVEKTCDAAAIVDSGRVVAQGSIAELTASGERLIDIGCADPVRARQLLDRHPAIGRVSETADGIVLSLRDDAAGQDVAAKLNRMLVQAGVDVYRLEVSRASLETRFLEVTSRLGGAA